MIRRTRFTAVLAALALALSALVLVSAPADAAGAKKSKRPKVGQCRTTTYDQAFKNSDPRKPVPCYQPHRMKTFVVVTPPKRFNLDKIHRTKAKQRKWDLYVLDTCGPRFMKALGGSFDSRAQTAYTWWSFIPTKAQRKNGARWLRCDLSLLAAFPGGNSYSPPLPNYAFPMVGTRPITDVTRRCLANEYNDYITTCNKPHVARADQTFTITTSTPPTQATIDAQAAAKCPGKRITGPGGWNNLWVYTCFTNTTS